MCSIYFSILIWYFATLYSFSNLYLKVSFEHQPKFLHMVTFQLFLIVHNIFVYIPTIYNLCVHIIANTWLPLASHYHKNALWTCSCFWLSGPVQEMFNNMYLVFPYKYIFLLSTLNCFPKWLFWFTLLPVVHEASCFHTYTYVHVCKSDEFNLAKKKKNLLLFWLLLELIICQFLWLVNLHCLLWIKHSFIYFAYFLLGFLMCYQKSEYDPTFLDIKLILILNIL